MTQTSVASSAARAQEQSDAFRPLPRATPDPSREGRGDLSASVAFSALADVPSMAMGRGRRIRETEAEADALPTGCHVFLSSDGMTIFVGRNSRDNDRLSMRVADPDDFWFHAAPGSGSHVVVRNPENLEALPRETKRFAAALAAGYSKARRGGRGAVHMARAGDVTKPRGLAPGKVHLRRFTSLHASPLRLEDEGGQT